jgi:hypothetical protein
LPRRVGRAENKNRGDMIMLMRIFPVSGLAIVLATLGGCASGPTVKELRADVKSATFVQHGREPLNYKLGVVDGASFWAKGAESNASISVPWSAGTVAAANAAVNVAGAAGKAVEANRAPTVAEMMSRLYNRHSMVNDAGHALMLKLAGIWGVSYDRARVRQVAADAKLENESGNFIAFQPTTDLVLVFAVSELGITERPSLGGGLAAVATAGFNAKQVTAETRATLTAYKHDPGSGQYRRVWSSRCGVPVLAMDVTYPFPELVQSPEKARRLWDAATPKLVEWCSRYLDRTT